MAKGRPRDPARARRQTGHRRKPDEAPKPAPANVLTLAAPAGVRRFDPPAHLTDEGKEVWNNLLGTLGADAGHLTPADTFGLEALVRQYLRMREAGRLVDEYGLVSRTLTGDVRVTPFLRAERDATIAFLRLAEQYGLTIASRLRLGLMQLAGQSLLQALNADLDSE